MKHTTLIQTISPQRRQPHRALLVAAFLAITTTVYGADDKVLPGAACVPEQGANVTTFAYPYGTIQNQGTATKTVNCAIVRDNTTTTGGAAVTVRYSFGSAVSTTGLGCGLI
jgi:hypothetical protein